MIKRKPRTADEKAIFDILNEIDMLSKRYGFSCFIVGGFCREEYLGIDHTFESDVDMMAENYHGLELAGFVAEHFSVPISFHHRAGAAKLSIDGLDFDFQANNKIYDFLPEIRKSGLPQNNFTFNILSRDFTINTLAMGLRSGKMYDITGKGRKDLDDKILRTPLDPDIAIVNNALVVLRAIKFAVRDGYNIDLELQEAMKRNLGVLDTVETEKYNEIIDDIRQYDPEKAEKLLTAFGINNR